MKIRFAMALSTVFFAQTGWTESVPEAIARIEAELEALKSGLTIRDGTLRVTSDGGGLSGGGQISLGAHGEGEKSTARLSISVHDSPYLPLQVVNLRASADTGFGILYLSDRDSSNKVAIHGDGRIYVNGTGIHDYAEVLHLATRDGIHPGSVVAYDPTRKGLVPASRENARQVIGVISGAGGLRPGMIIGSREDGTEDLPVSMSGVIHVRVTDEAGNIRPGDLLVPSSTPGVGMRAPPTDRVAQLGEIFGKALEPRDGDGEGLALMLVLNN